MSNQEQSPAADLSVASDLTIRRIWVGVRVLVVGYLILLAVETILRTIFPWDMHMWSESPFLTNLLKLESHQPIFTTPADANSFVYSPGLEYITFHLLRPFGVELDIRYCRLINDLLGVAAAGCGAVLWRQLVRTEGGWGRFADSFWLNWGILTLVLFKNFTADVPHPDNLHTLHAVLTFLLCFKALETRRAGLALLTMAVAGVGVLTKQTEALAFVGPAAALAIYNVWGRRWFLFAGVGVLSFGLSLGLLWHPPFARFYTFELLSHQGLLPSKLGDFITSLCWLDRGALLGLAFLAIALFWRRGAAARRFLICWFLIGFFCIAPNMLAYLKTFGASNNLGILEVWFALLAWPMAVQVMESFPRILQEHRASAEATPGSRRDLVALVLTSALLLFLVPIKGPPSRDLYRYCRAVDTAVHQDIRAGRKVLVSHGTEFLIRAGDLNPPLDRVNSFLELMAGRADESTGTRSRIASGYYDRIYLFKEDWYEPDVVDLIHKNYNVDFVIPGVQYWRSVASGNQALCTKCEVLSVKPRN